MLKTFALACIASMSLATKIATEVTSKVKEGGECVPPAEEIKRSEFKIKLEDMQVTHPIKHAPNCFYEYQEVMDDESRYMSMFKIDCPSEPDRVFQFEIDQDPWEWEDLQYMYEDSCSANCTSLQHAATTDVPKYDRQRYTFKLSHASGQTKGGFIGPPGGYGYRRYMVHSEVEGEEPPPM